MSTAYFFIAHGSRDPRPADALQGCVQTVQRYYPGQSVGAGTLEYGGQSLTDQILAFAQQVNPQRIVILPLFLLAGVHVCEDIPAAVRAAQRQLAHCQLEIVPHFGESAMLTQLIQSQAQGCDRWILLAHGTRRPNGNQGFEALAQQLNMATAYWAIQPNLEQVLDELAPSQSHRVGILPFFLFSGTLTDAIAVEVQRLKMDQGYNLHLSEPLNPALILPQMIHDWAERPLAGVIY